jgi:hypothetical protein
MMPAAMNSDALKIAAQQQRDQPQMAQGRIRQQPFQIVLEQRRIGREQQGDQAGAADQIKPQVASGQHWKQPRQQKHAGLDHGRRVQIRAHRRRRGHRVRQPEVKRKLRGFGERAEQDQRQDRRVQRMRSYRLAGIQNHRQLEAAGDMTQQHHARQQRQSAAAGNGQRHARALTGVRPVWPIADQQKRPEAGQLPEHQH